jgi:hypothetical protein
LLPAKQLGRHEWRRSTAAALGQRRRRRGEKRSRGKDKDEIERAIVLFHNTP